MLKILLKTYSELILSNLVVLPFYRSGVAESIHFKQAPAMPAKTKTTSMTNYSKRLAATKALKQSKANNALPSTLLWMK